MYIRQTKFMVEVKYAKAAKKYLPHSLSLYIISTFIHLLITVATNDHFKFNCYIFTRLLYNYFTLFDIVVGIHFEQQSLTLSH